MGRASGAIEILVSKTLNAQYGVLRFSLERIGQDQKWEGRKERGEERGGGGKDRQRRGEEWTRAEEDGTASTLGGQLCGVRRLCTRVRWLREETTASCLAQDLQWNIVVTGERIDTSHLQNGRRAAYIVAIVAFSTSSTFLSLYRVPLTHFEVQSRFR
jgi:hypothetical protein